MHKQIVIIEYRNGGTFVYEVKSASPITVDKAADYFQKTENFNEDRDSLTLLGEELTSIDLDVPVEAPTEE